MQRVLVQNIEGGALMPCNPARARKRLSSDRACVVRRYPFTIQLTQGMPSHTQPLQLKLDPGSKTTGISIVALFQSGYRALWAANLEHLEESGERVFIPPTLQSLTIRAQGHGSRQFTKPNASGFPRTLPQPKSPFVQGFKTGDWVVASVPAGKKAGTHVEKVAVRSAGFFNITTNKVTVQGISFKFCKKVQCADGYNYLNRGGNAFPTKPVGSGRSILAENR